MCARACRDQPEVSASSPCSGARLLAARAGHRQRHQQWAHTPPPPPQPLRSSVVPWCFLHALAGINLRAALQVLAVAHVSSLPELVVGNGTNSGRIHRRRRSSHSSQALGVSPCGAGALVSAAWGQQPLASKQQPSRVPSAAAPSEVVARTLASSQPAATASSSSQQQQPGAQRAEQCQWCERYAQLNWRRRQQAQVL